MGVQFGKEFYEILGAGMSCRVQKYEQALEFALGRQLGRYESLVVRSPFAYVDICTRLSENIPLHDDSDSGPYIGWLLFELRGLANKENLLKYLHFLENYKWGLKRM